MTHDLKFGWLSPVIGNAGSDHQAVSYTHLRAHET